MSRLVALGGSSTSSAVRASLAALASPLSVDPPDESSGGKGDLRHPGSMAGWKRGILIAVGIIGIAALAVGAIVYLPRAFTIRTLQISGLVTVPEEDIRTIVGLRAQDTLFSVDPAALQTRLAADPRLKSASVSLGLPSTLHVKLEERRPVAYILSMVDGGMRPLLVDSTGFVYGWGYGSLPPLPLVSAPGVEAPRPGTWLPGDMAGIFASLGRLDDPGHSILSEFSEIRVVRLASGRSELLLYPMHTRIPVRTSSVLELDRMRAVIIALDVLGSGPTGGEVREIDARGSVLAYRLKEEQAG